MTDYHAAFRVLAEACESAYGDESKHSSKWCAFLHLLAMAIRNHDSGSRKVAESDLRYAGHFAGELTGGVPLLARLSTALGLAAGRE